MNPLRYLNGVTRFFRGRALAVAIPTVFYLLSGATGAYAQQAQSLPAPGKDIPTLEALPHNPMSHGEFQGWCGLNDVALVRAELLEAFADGAKLSTLLVPRKAQAQCSDDGQRMAVVYDDAGWITEVAVRSAAVTRKLATFERDRLTTISFSGFEECCIRSAAHFSFGCARFESH